MKAVWIGCSILCLLGFVCSVMLAMSGWSILRSAQSERRQAETFAAATADAFCRSWNPDTLRARLDGEAQPGLVAAASRAGRQLGPLTVAGPFNAVAMAVRRERGEKVVRTTVRDTAAFQRGSAQIEMVVVHGGGRMAIRDFEIKALDGR